MTKLQPVFGNPIPVPPDLVGTRARIRGDIMAIRRFGLPATHPRMIVRVVDDDSGDYWFLEAPIPKGVRHEALTRVDFWVTILGVDDEGYAVGFHPRVHTDAEP